MTAPSGPAPWTGRADDDRGRLWVDRRGGVHPERARGFDLEALAVPAARRRSQVESDWDATGAGGASSVGSAGSAEGAGRAETPADPGAARRRALAGALAGPSPQAATDPDEPGRALMTWTVRAPGATSVLLEVNGLFPAGGVDALEMTRLTGTEVWTSAWSVPADWSASYGVAAWRGEGAPPWRATSGRRARLAAMRAARPDPRAVRVIGSSFGAPRSVASAPRAPAPPWEGLTVPRRRGRVHRLAVPLPAGGACAVTEADGRPAEGTTGSAPPSGASERVWVYEPAGGAARTPVLILFDGQVWLRQMGLVPALDALIGSGLLPPVHVAMIDSRDQGEYRAEHLGVPGGHVDLVIDELLPLLRRRFAVSPRGADTVVAGQSYGGIASLWTLALADGEVGHAIAQSPSLWRFDVAGALAAGERWLTARILSGTFEGPMLTHACELAQALGGRRVTVTPVSGGHDWAWWSVRLLTELAELVDLLPACSGTGAER